MTTVLRPARRAVDHDSAVPALGARRASGDDGGRLTEAPARALCASASSALTPTTTRAEVAGTGLGAGPLPPS